MDDLVLTVVVLAFFALALLAVRGCEAIVDRSGREERAE